MIELHLLNGKVDKFLPHEVFIPENNIGPVTKQFPYTWAVLKLLVHERVCSRIMGQASWSRFLEAGHVSQAFPAMLGIVKNFMKNVRQEVRNA